MKRIVFFVIVMAFVTFTIGQNVGDLAPNFTLNKTDGTSYKLSDQRGKVVLLFFLGDKCSSCRSIAPSIQSNIVDAFKENAQFTAIGIDTWNGTNSSVNSFKTTTGIGFDILTQGSSVANNWSISYDRLAVVDDKGYLVFKGQGLASSHLSQAKDAVSMALGKITASNGEINSSAENFKVYPMPFSNKANLIFSNEKYGNIDISLFDLTGKKIKTILNDVYSAGDHSVSFISEELPNGMYLLQLKTANTRNVLRVVLE